MKTFKRFALPYLIWMLVLIVAPIVLMLILTFVQTKGFNLQGGVISFSAFTRLFSLTYMTAFYNSFRLALIATVLCALVGYPTAYFISRINGKYRFMFMLLLIFPMCTNMLLQISTINRLLKPISILNDIGVSLNLSGSEGAIIVVMVLMYLPFMVFPIYTVLEKIEPSLLEASFDLGANKRKTFLKVTLPLSMKGVSSGIIMVFLPCATGFAIPQIVSNGNILLIGEVIEEAMGLSKSGGTDYSFGSLISIIILVVVIGALLIISKIDAEGETLL
jgi:spermidine/putrescine transport system permease protein